MQLGENLTASSVQIAKLGGIIEEVLQSVISLCLRLWAPIQYVHYNILSLIRNNKKHLIFFKRFLWPSSLNELIYRTNQNLATKTKKCDYNYTTIEAPPGSAWLTIYSTLCVHCTVAIAANRGNVCSVSDMLGAGAGSV